MFKMVFIVQRNGDELFIRQEYQQIKQLYGDKIHLDLFSDAEVDYDDAKYESCQLAIKAADFVYINVHGALPYFKRFNALQKIFSGNTPAFIRSGIDEENAEMQKQSSLSAILYAQLTKYLIAGGPENYRSFMHLIMKELGNFDCEPAEVIIPKWEGLYGLPAGISEDEYLKSITLQTAQPIIGILVHYHNIRNQNTLHIDALIDSIKAHGAIPLVLYTNILPLGPKHPGLRGALKKYLMQDGKSLIDALIVTTGFSLSLLSAPGDGKSRLETSVFELLDVPVLQAMHTFYSYQKWRESLAGVDPMLLNCNVYQTEFDGQIITVTIAYTETVETPYGSKNVTHPIQERVNKVVRLSINWAKLRKKDIRHKKVAIILHNMPPRADMIGCAYGLDTPESVYNMYRLLHEQGLPLAYEFANGQEIIQKITAGLTNDGRFLSETEMLERSAAIAERADYMPWFAALPEKPLAELERDWGQMPGSFMVVEDKILIPGILNGNLFIGLQPPRAYEEQAEEMYHSTDLVCPYQYLAFYRYLEHKFGADIIVHVGTHGTIEWLPGKEIGLSEECYPDLAIGDLPHLYPYIIDVPGEGVQAKRRTAAVILDHLIPSMTEGGMYGALAEIDGLIAQYYRARTENQSKLEIIATQIWQAATAANLHTDLGLTEAEFWADIDTAAEKLHLWLSDIKSSKIKDGLHIFGNVPVDERYSNLLRLLVAVPNDDVPSLRQALCALKGLNYEALLANPGHQLPDGRTNALLLEEIDQLGRQLFVSFGELGFTAESVNTIVEALAGEQKLPLQKCLNFVAQEIKPRVDATTDELKYFARGIAGRFIAPGPSGAPSRGNAIILPTGRNFYMIDPTAVPSRSAWETGKLLGDQLIQRYLQDEGQYPESVAIVVYSGETIKTTGDDLAEIMYLYGVRPVWIPNTDRVIDLEVIPLEELGRPRIDVTLRISGLFRDTFPNLIERIEDAVNLVATLDEDPEMNFVKKHVWADFADFIDQGLQKDQAFEQAKLRIFGCPPGTYGAGVDILVNSKKWQTADDLGRAYINWGAHAYGKNIHGAKLEGVFARRLATTDITVKNISSFEADMLDSDDFYNYHGGLNAAVKQQRGSYSASYTTNAGDPKHVVTRSIHEETSRIMRARINNPKWIAGLKEHGFRGAQEFSKMMDIVFGWDATSDVVDNWMYDSIAQTYLLDEDLQTWIKAANPWALQAISERLLEAAKRGMWDADEATLEQLKEIYLSIEDDLEGM